MERAPDHELREVERLEELAERAEIAAMRGDLGRERPFWCGPRERMVISYRRRTRMYQNVSKSSISRIRRLYDNT